jgi:hypothetical protein
VSRYAAQGIGICVRERFNQFVTKKHQSGLCLRKVDAISLAWEAIEVKVNYFFATNSVRVSSHCKPKQGIKL